MTAQQTNLLQYGYSDTFTINVKANVEVTLEWEKGEYDSECSFSVKNSNGKNIYSSTGFDKGEFLFSWVNECSCLNDYFTMCDAVENLVGEQNQNVIEISWDNAENAISYDIYRGTRFMGTTNETSFTDDYKLKDGTYLYNVQANYDDDCKGLLSTTEVTFNTESVMENEINNASIFPNPSNGEFTVQFDNMTHILIYNVIGSLVKDIETNADNYVVKGLKSGVYFVNIRNNDNNIIKKVVVR